MWMWKILLVKLHSMMLAGKYPSSLPGNSLTGVSSTHWKLMKHFGVRWLLVLVLLLVTYIPQLLGDVMTKHEIQQKLFRKGLIVNSMWDVQYLLLWNYDAVLDHAMSGYHADGRCSNFTLQDCSLGLNACAVWTLNTFHLVWHNLKLHHWCSTIVVGLHPTCLKSLSAEILLVMLALPLFFFQSAEGPLWPWYVHFLVSHSCNGTRLCVSSLQWNGSFCSLGSSESIVLWLSIH